MAVLSSVTLNFVKYASVVAFSAKKSQQWQDVVTELSGISILIAGSLQVVNDINTGSQKFHRSR